jgi:hypothetical protein
MPIRMGKAGRIADYTEESYFVDQLTSRNDMVARTHLYGASAAYCPRQNFLLSKDWSNRWDVSPLSEMYMGIGNGIEGALVSALRRNGKLFTTNPYIPPIEPKVSGKIDLIYLDRNDQIALGEVKSCGKLPTRPKDAHRLQLLTYGAVSGFDNCNLIYVSRNVTSDQKNLDIRIFNLPINEDVLKIIFGKIVLSQIGIDLGLMPPIPDDFRKSYHCGFCSFNKICWAGEHVDFNHMTVEKINELKPQIDLQVAKLIDERKQRKIDYINYIESKIEDESLKERLRQEVTHLLKEE